MAMMHSRTSGVRRVLRRGTFEAPDPARRAALSAGAERLGRPLAEHWRSMPRWAGGFGPLAYAVHRINGRGRATGVLTFEHGLVIVYDRRSVVVPWPQVLTVKQQITEYFDRVGQASRAMRTKFDITLDCQGLAPIHLTEEFQDVGVLAERIESEVTRRRLADTVRVVQDGATVSFGPLAVGPHGIDNGQTILPWPRVLDVRVTAGRVIVLEDGPLLSWCDHRVGDIPNLAIFLALVRSNTGDGDWPDGG